MKWLIFILSISIFQSSYAQNYSSCGKNKKSKELAQLIINSNLQKRTEIVCNQKLSEIAYLKAKELAKIDKIRHNIDHISPNQFLSQHGVKLPFLYNYVGNQVEAIQGGVQTSQEAFKYFLTSEDHKSQLMAENKFFQGQNQLGVGYYSDKSTIYEDFWVVYITALREKDDKAMNGKQFKYKIINDFTKTEAKDISAKERRENRLQENSKRLIRIRQ